MAYKKQKGGPKMYRKDGALPMKSPMKNINNMKAYSKPGDAVQFGDAPTDMKAPTYMKSPLEAAKPDYIDIDKDGNTTESMKEASMAKMKSSGFKMKSGSPMKRNFGIGSTPSPMKERGVYESILDEETGKLNTNQVSRDKIKDITAQRNKIQNQLKGVEEQIQDENGETIDNPEYVALRDQLTDLTNASNNFTLTGDDVMLGTSNQDVASANQDLQDKSDETGVDFTPTTKAKMNQLDKAKKTEQGYSKGILNELQKDNSGRVTSDQYSNLNPGAPVEEEQLIDEDTIFRGNVKHNTSRHHLSQGQVTEQMMNDIQNKIDAGEELSDDDKVIQQTYINGLGKGAGSDGNLNTAAYQDGASTNAAGDKVPEGGGHTMVNNELVPSTDGNTNVYKHPNGEMVLFQDLPNAMQGKIAAGEVREEANIDRSNAADAKEKQDAADESAKWNSQEQKDIRSNHFDNQPEEGSMSNRKYKKAMALWKQKAEELGIGGY